VSGRILWLTKDKRCIRGGRYLGESGQGREYESNVESGSGSGAGWAAKRDCDR
jgi:hypothetical protein